MSKTKWYSRVLYLAIALALTVSLAGLAVVSAHPATSEWSPVDTPTENDWVIAQDSDIYDFDIGPDGDIIYAVGVGRDKDDLDGDAIKLEIVAQIWKSDDAGVTWDAITDELHDDLDFDATTDFLYFVTVAPDDADFLAVAGWETGVGPFVYGSDDGGDHFFDAAFQAVSNDLILCLDMSPDRNDTHGIAVGTDGGELWIYIAGSVWGGMWKDTTLKDGWMVSSRVTSVVFSTNWAADDTILTLTTNTTDNMDGDTYQQSGLWGTTKAWNAEAGSPFPAAVKIINAPPLFDNINAIESGTGIALPDDFSGYDSGLRYSWVYVNWDTQYSEADPASFDAAFVEVGQVFRIKGPTVKYAGIACERWDTSGKYPLMASISMTGEIDDGNLMVGLLGEETDGAPTDCCEGVQVYRTTEWPIDYYCPQWSSAKKPPTGMWNCVVAYTPDGSKAYAVTSSNAKENAGKKWDESAFSLSDVGEVAEYWNQASLVDTYADGAAASVSIEPQSQTVAPSGTFNIDVWVDAAGRDLNGIDVAVRYNSNVMTTSVADVEAHNLVGGLEMGPEVNEVGGVGEVTYALASADAVADISASVMTIQFTVDEDADPTVYPLTITKADLSDLGGIWGDTETNDGTVTVVIGRKGDLDGDGHIDIFDFVLFATAYGSVSTDPNYNVVGDFDDDGDIDIFDFVQFAGVYGT